MRRKRGFRRLKLAEWSLVGCFGKSHHPGCQCLGGIMPAPSSEAEGVLEAGCEGLYFFPMNFQKGAKP